MLTRRWEQSVTPTANATPTVNATAANTSTYKWKQWSLGSILWEMDATSLRVYKRISVRQNTENQIVEILACLDEEPVPLEAIVTNTLPFTHVSKKDSQISLANIGNWTVQYEYSAAPSLLLQTQQTPRQIPTKPIKTEHKNYNTPRHEKDESMKQYRAPSTNHLIQQKTKLSSHLSTNQQHMRQQLSRPRHTPRPVHHNQIDTSVALFQDE
jgi:hypothetical protein